MLTTAILAIGIFVVVPADVSARHDTSSEFPTSNGAWVQASAKGAHDHDSAAPCLTMIDTNGDGEEDTEVTGELEHNHHNGKAFRCFFDEVEE